MDEPKELQKATDYLKNNPNIQQDRYSMEALDYIKQALTPPTKEEVCRALSEYYTKNNNDVNEYDFKYIDKNFVSRGKMKHGGKYALYLSEQVILSLPPHLITMIGKFYENESEATK